MNTPNNNQPETVYDVSFKYTHEYLKQSFFKELLEKYHNQLPEIVKAQTDVFENDQLMELKILKAPDFDEVWDKAIKIDSLIEYLTNDIEKYMSQKKPENVIDVIYNGQDKKNPKGNIYPEIIIEDIGHTHMIIDLAKEMLDEISAKFATYQSFIEYHMKEKENIEERDQDKLKYFSDHLDFYNANQDKFTVEEKEKIIKALKRNDYKKAAELVMQKKNEAANVSN